MDRIIRLTNRTCVCPVLIVLALLGASCGGAAAPSPTAPPAVAAPTDTPMPAPPTDEPAPLPPTAAPLPTPTPVPPSPQAMLETALSALGEDTYHFVTDMQMTMTGSGMDQEVPVFFAGDCQPPDRMQAALHMTVFTVTIESDLIAIGEERYATNPDTGEWETNPEWAADLWPEESSGIEPADIEGLAVVGEEILDGMAVYHLQGEASAQDMGYASQSFEGEFRLEYWIAVEDGRLRQYVAEGEVTELGGQALTYDVAATTTYSEYGKRLAIEPPQLPVMPVVVSCQPTRAEPVLHPEWTSYTNVESVFDVLRTGDDLWVATLGGVLRWNLAAGTCVKYTTEHGLASNRVKAIAVDGDGALWFSTFAGGVSRFDGRTWTTYTEQDGLASNKVWDIAVDREGTVWLGTDRGVSRFTGPATSTGASPAASTGSDPATGADGGQPWTTYTTADRLAGNEVPAIAVAEDGTLWFGTIGGGVSRLASPAASTGTGPATSTGDGQTWTTYTEDDGLGSNSVFAIAMDKDGALWFGTEGGGVSRFAGPSDRTGTGSATSTGEDGTWTTYTEEDGLASDAIWTIALDTEGTPWVGTYDGGVSRFASPAASTGTAPASSTGDGHTWTTYTAEDGLAGNGVRAITVDADGTLWLATSGGVSRFTGPATSTGASPAASAGSRSAASTNGDGDWTTYSVEESLAENSVTAVAVDKEGALWFGTEGGGVSRFASPAASTGDRQSWTSWDTADGLAGPSVAAIVVDGEGAVWVATCCDGASRFASPAASTGTGPAVGTGGDQGWTTYTQADGLSNNEFLSMALDGEGVLWFGHYGAGVSRFDGETWTRYREEDGLAHDWVAAIAADQEGALWFGTGGGVSRFASSAASVGDGQAWTTYTAEDGLASDLTYSLAVDGDGALWIGTFDAGVSRFDGQTWTTYSVEDGLADSWVRAIAVDSEGALWFGTRGELNGEGGGVSRFDGQTWTTYTEDDGLVANWVNDIALDGEGSLWFATEGGVSRYSPSTKPPDASRPAATEVSSTTPTPTTSPPSTPVPASTASPQPEDAPPVKEVGDERIAFVSDRDGNDEIYLMKTDGSGQTRLTDNSTSDSFPAWSPDGRRIAFRSYRNGNAEIYVMNADGSGQTRLTNQPGDDDLPAWSPDGRKIAFVSSTSFNSDIYVMNSDGSGQTNLTKSLDADSFPAWSPDGRRIAFMSDRDGNAEIYVMNADGSGQTRLTDDLASDSVPTWSPDGRRIAFMSDRDGNPQVYVINADGSGQTRLTNTPGNEGFPAWSPDGKRIAFMSDRDGNFEIYAMNADGSGQTNLTSNLAEDAFPAWSP